METENIRVFIADDHQIFIDGLRTILKHEKRLELAETANDGQEAWEKMRAGGYDLLITDIGMPVMDGIALTRQVKASFPGLHVLALTMYNDREIVMDVLDAEADGYVLKNSGKKELLRAIYSILDGGAYYSRELIPILNERSPVKQAAPEVPLSPRELEVLKLICDEFSTRQIADRLFISPRTVETHRKHILQKSGARTLVGLIKYAYKHGLTE